MNHHNVVSNWPVWVADLKAVYRDSDDWGMLKKFQTKHAYSNNNDLLCEPAQRRLWAHGFGATDMH